MVTTPPRYTALLALLILWVVNQLHLPADLGVKGLNSINLLMLICVLVLFRMRYPQSEPTPIRAAFFLFFAMLVWGFIAGQLHDRSQIVDDLTALKNSIFFMSLYFLFFHAVRDERTVHLLFVAILGVAVLAAYEGIREAMAYGFGVYSESRRAAGPFGEDYRASNLLAIYLVMFTPPLVGVALYARGRPWIRLIALAAIVMMVLATFSTYSRQAYGILAFSILAMTMRRNLILGALIMLALLNFEAWVPAGVVDRIAMTEEVTETGEKTVDGSTASRFELWEAASTLRAQRPLGIGLNHFKREVGNVNPHYAGMDAHNFFVLISTEAGYFGAVAVAVLCAALLWLAWTFMKRADTPESKAMAIGFMVSTLALILGNLYGSRILDGAVTGTYWVYAALIARYRVLIETDHRQVRRSVGESTAAHADGHGATTPPRPGPLPAGAVGRAGTRDRQSGRRQEPATVSRHRASPAPPRQRDRNGRLLPAGSPAQGRH